MSDLESVDLSNDSDTETVDGTPPASTPAPPKKSAMPSTPQRTPQRNAASRLATSSAQNGTISPRRRLKERKDLTASPPKPPAVGAAKSAPSKTVSAKIPEKTPAKPTGEVDAVQNPPPPKPKRGRPKKNKTQPRSEAGAVAPPQPASKPVASAKTATAKTAATATPDPPSTQTAAPKTAAKSGDGEAPRPSARGRKRQLLTKPVETTSAEKAQEKAVPAATLSSQEPPAPENGAPKQKRSAKIADKRLHGAAAKSSAQKRRREEVEHNVTFVPKNAPSRGGKKDGEGPSPEVSEVPPSPVKKGRPSKRLKQQAARQVTSEVIRIEDDDSSPERNSARAPPKNDAENEDQATVTASAENSEKNNAVAAVPSKGRQSLPASYGQTAPRRTKARDLTSAAAANRRLDGPSQNESEETDEGAPKKQGTGPQKQKESRKAPGRVRKPRVTRHSTGNLSPMDTGGNEQPESTANDETDGVSNKEALESMLDGIQRNAIPFLLKQDKICDSFSARMEKEIDGTLNNTDSDVFQVFSDQVKDALVADRLRLAVASAKTDLRRGIEKLLREFARKVGAPMSDESSSLLLRDEAFRSTRAVKEERRLSKPFGITSPRISKLTPLRRLAEENHDPNKAHYRDFISDDADRHATTPRSRSAPLKDDIPLLNNVADLKKFVAYSYENLNLNCYRALTIIKLCARPGGMTITGLHEVTPLGLQMIRNKVRDLIDRGYLVEDMIRDNGVNTAVYSTAAHISEA